MSKNRTSIFKLTILYLILVLYIRSVKNGLLRTVFFALLFINSTPHSKEMAAWLPFLAFCDYVLTSVGVAC